MCASGVILHAQCAIGAAGDWFFICFMLCDDGKRYQREFVTFFLSRPVQAIV